jgi:hypothetical protein
MKNRNRILDAMNAPVECECGCSVHKSKYPTHVQTYKHKKYMLRKGLPDKYSDVIEKIYVLTKKIPREDMALIGNAIGSMLVY